MRHAASAVSFRHHDAAARTCLASSGLISVLLLGMVLAAPVLAADAKPDTKSDAKSGAKAASAPARAVLSVTVTQPTPAMVTNRLQANGNIAPWQEAIIGAEVNGLKLSAVNVEVGDVVKRGQVLASFNAATLKTDAAQLEAALAEAQAAADDARSNAERARQLQGSNALSAQQIQQYLTAEQSTRARVAAQRAALQSQQLRLSQTQVVAPDGGVISARNATVGAVVPAGQELFRLIRSGRLEWRAEVSAADLGRLQVGQKARIDLPSGQTLDGTVRKVSPSIDAQTRMGLVYVDVPTDPQARAGQFARGSFAAGSRSGVTVPASAVLLRDGFQVVMRVGPDARVSAAKVTVLSRDGDRIAVDGLTPDTRVVVTGGAFLSDGDTVRVVTAPPVPPPVAAVAVPAASSPGKR